MPRTSGAGEVSPAVPPAVSRVEPAELRTVLGHFASGVVVVTGVGAVGPTGLTCQSFFSLSLTPPLIAVSPSKSSTSWPSIAPEGSFCVNVLDESQHTTATHFARAGHEKFATVSWSPCPKSGAPRLHGALAWIDCGIHAVHDAGDHLLVIGSVEDLGVGPGVPLLYYRGEFGGYHPIPPHRTGPATARTRRASRPAGSGS